MKLLLDTCTWIWWISQPSRLSPETTTLLAGRENQVFFSAVSGLEVAIKYGLGRLTLPELPERFIPPRLVRDGFEVLPVNLAHSLAVASLPFHHRDPFDRLLVAQARLEDLTLVTGDAHLQNYAIKIHLA